MSHKLEQFTADIERGVRDVLSKGLQDPRVGGLITVTAVRVLPDLSRAFIDISIMPEARQELCFHGITAAAAYIRREVSNSVRARVLPEFVFRLDTKLKKEAAILKGLEQIRAERRSKGLPEIPEPIPAEGDEIDQTDETDESADQVDTYLREDTNDPASNEHIDPERPDPPPGQPHP